MYVKDIPSSAHARLMLIADDASLIEAAKFLTSGSEIVVVRDNEGITRGVVTKTDVVRKMSVCKGAECRCPVSSAMTHDVVLCRENDLLRDVSVKMKARNLKNIIVVDEAERPLAVLTARAILRLLLGDAEDMENKLVEYVNGAGYR